MARIITKERALRIADKLGAKLYKGRQSHLHADIYHEDKLIARFSIRHSSNREIGHDFISKDLHVGPHDARLLAECPLTRDGWIEILRGKGIVPEASTTNEFKK